jgi:hypothetical protein
MDTQTIFAVAGIASTVILGIWAIIITIRYNRSVEITYAHQLAIALIDDITQNFPDMKVLFRNKPVSENLVLLKGYFINTGKKDISHEMIEKQLTLTLPTGFEWVECKVVELSPGLKVIANLMGKTEISLETGLWKAKEYLKVEALAKVPVVKADLDNFPADYPTERLLKALTFPHRIADSKIVRKTSVPLFFSSRILRILGFPLHLDTFSHTRVFITFAIAFLFLGAVSWSLNNFLPYKTIGYRMSMDGKERLVSMSIKHDKVILQDKQGFKKEYTLPEFENVADKQPEIITVNDPMPTFLGLICISLGIIMLFISGTKIIRESQLLVMISSKNRH